MAENRRTRRVKAKVTAKQRSDVTKTTRARKAYVRKQELAAGGAAKFAEHYEKGTSYSSHSPKVKAEQHKRLSKISAAAKKRASQARKSTGPRKMKK